MSELLFLGTGAADWNIEHKTEFFRRYSAALLDECMLLDCGPHIFDFAKDFKREDLYDGVTDILITHSHGDHFVPESVLKIAEKNKIRVGCDVHTKKEIGAHENIEFILLKPYQATMFGNYMVTPLLANHHFVVDETHLACHFIIETPDHTKVFYGLDGAWFLCPSWEEMKKHKFDIMVLDTTCGDYHDWRVFEHNTIPMLREMVQEIKAQDMIKPNGKIIASHLARTLHVSHEETAKILEEFGMVCAYDGMKA